jgi:hypothetical protein
MKLRVVFKRGLLCCAGLAICILTSSPRGLVVFVLLAVCAFSIQRALWKMKGRSEGNRFGFFPTYTSVGNALQQLQMLAEPQTGYIIEEKLADEADEDDDGELEDEADLIRQFRQIRNGDRRAQLVVSRGCPEKITVRSSQ